MTDSWNWDNEELRREPSGATLTASQLRELRRIWVAGAFPTTGKAQAAAALVIDTLIKECFTLREAIRKARTAAERAKDIALDEGPKHTNEENQGEV